MYIHQSRQNTQSSTNSWESRQSSRSNGSQESRSSTATSFNEDDIDKAYYSEQATPLALHRTPKHKEHIRYDDDISVSVCSFDSKESQEPCYFDEPQEYHSYQPTYEQNYASSRSSRPEPTCPETYPDYFPTANRLSISHEDSNDGNMNLIVTTEVPEGSHKTKKQLFHLRMHDLTARNFSVRRYCRESGREVCTSTIKKPSAVQLAAQRPTLGRSVSNALSSLRRTNSGGSHKSRKSTKSDHSTNSLKIITQDSGYETEESALESDSAFEEEEEASDSSATQTKFPSNNLKLEFSNYAQSTLTRKGDKKSKHWDFEYLCEHYTWKRKVDNDGVLGKQYSYHLIRNDTQQEAARIMPNIRTKEEQEHEAEMGGWIPPCTMWIHDEDILAADADKAEAMVATGLLALTDDNVRRLEKKRDAAAKAKSGLSRSVSFKFGKKGELVIDFLNYGALMNHMLGKRIKQDRPATPRRITGGKIPTSPLKHHVPTYLG